MNDQQIQSLALTTATQYSLPQDQVERLFHRLSRNQAAPVLIGYAMALINQGVDVQVLTKAAAMFQVAAIDAERKREPS